MILSRLLLTFSLVVFSLLASLVPTTAEAAAYQLRNGGISGPILFEGSGLNHPYSGIDLAPGTDLTGAGLRDAYLQDADLHSSILRGANLRDIWLHDADLTNVDLENGNIRGARMVSAILQGASLVGLDFFGTDLSNVDLRGADLSNAFWLQEVIGSPQYDATTIFTGADANATGTPFDPVAAGWKFIVVVPEPGTAMLLGLGLIGMAARRRA